MKHISTLLPISYCALTSHIMLLLRLWILYSLSTQNLFRFLTSPKSFSNSNTANMPVIINKSAALQSLLIKNKDTRSESIDSFSSTVDVHAPFHAHGQSKLPHYYPDKANEELIVDDDLSFSSTSTLSTYANPSSSSIRDASSPHFDFKLPHKHNQNQTLAPQEQQRRQSALNSILAQPASIMPKAAD